MAMLMRRLGAGQFTVHGFRSSCRNRRHVRGRGSIAGSRHREQGHPPYLRTTMLERRRPIMAAWANFVSGSDADNVVPLRRAAAGE